MVNSHKKKYSKEEMIILQYPVYLRFRIRRKLSSINRLIAITLVLNNQHQSIKNRIHGVVFHTLRHPQLERYMPPDAH